MRLRQELQAALDVLALVKQREEIKMKLTKISCQKITNSLSSPRDLFALLYQNDAGKSRVLKKKTNKEKAKNRNGEVPGSRKRVKKQESGEGDTEHKKKRRKTTHIKDEPTNQKPILTVKRIRVVQKPRDVKPEESQELVLEQQRDRRRLSDLSSSLGRGFVTETPKPESTEIPVTEEVEIAAPIEKVKLTYWQKLEMERKRKLQFHHRVEPFDDNAGELEDKYVWCSLIQTPEREKQTSTASSKIPIRNHLRPTIVLPKKGEDPYIGRRRVGRGGRVWWDLRKVKEPEDDTISISDFAPDTVISPPQSQIYSSISIAHTNNEPTQTSNTSPVQDCKNELGVNNVDRNLVSNSDNIPKSHWATLTRLYQYNLK